jgi:hypothetical protein
MEENDPTFSHEEIRDALKGWCEKYPNLNIMDLFRGSGMTSIEDDKLTLNDHGKDLCKKGQLSL